jgi:hypothetical protein
LIVSKGEFDGAGGVLAVAWSLHNKLHVGNDKGRLGSGSVKNMFSRKGAKEPRKPK